MMENTGNGTIGAGNGRKWIKTEKAHVLSCFGAEREKPLSRRDGNDGKRVKKSTLNKIIARFFSKKHLNSIAP